MNQFIFVCFFLVNFINARSDQECSKTICYPTAGDLLIGRESMLRASSTCGMERPEAYCVVTLTDRGTDSKCSHCDSRTQFDLNSGRDSHRIGNVVSRLPQNSARWWQSSNGIHNASIEVEFATEFQFIFTQLRFKTYRPAAMYIQRSKDFGLTWQKSAYFSDNCAQDFPQVPERKRNNILEVTCTSEFSYISPSEGGTVLFVATPSDLHTNDEDWVKQKNDITAITNLRVQFVRLHTFGDLKIDNNPNILNKYHYAVSEWIIRGRCSCYGHADVCKAKNGEIQKKEMVYGVCLCKHNTIGPNCEKCKDFYNDKPWRPAENNATNECKKCECNSHSTSCHFDSAVFELSGRKSGGICDNCIHNTEGINCQRCTSGHYRNSQVNISSGDTCIKCKCDQKGAKSLYDPCNQETEPDRNIIAGSCICKPNVGGFYCDRCAIGFWNFDKMNEEGCTKCNCLMSGTINNESCDQRSGDCICKKFVEGKLCNICKNGYYNISPSNPSGCSPCTCSHRGSMDYETCDRSSGQCKCKQGYTGLTCTEIKDGFFVISPRYPLKYKENVQIELPPVSKSGLYNFIITFDTQQVAIVDTYIAVLTIDHPIKTSCSAYEEITPIVKDTKQFIVPNKCLVQDVPIVLNVFLVIEPTAGSKQHVIIDAKVVPNLSLNNTETIAALAECLKYPPHSMPPKCDYLRLIYSSRVVGTKHPLACNCNVTGSVNYICNKLGGQCNCLPNVMGRQCDQCNSNFYGFDAMGCKNCSCEPKGSLNLQCASDTGKCLCRVGLEGRHCNYCKAGFWRFPNCNPCKCNSMADICDATTGQCTNCRGNSIGFNCQQCTIGYYGDPSKNVPCLKCNCPGLSMDLNHSNKCNLVANTTSYVCDCKPGYKGQFCNECDDNYYGNPREKNGRCSACLCSSNIDRTVPGGCDVRTGECKKCLYNTVGINCEKCALGYFGNGISRTCQKCVCNRLGTNTAVQEICHHQTGKCPCLPNVIGQQCDQCQIGFFNISSGIGCLPCQCDSSNGALNETCNHLTGQCHCRPSRGGRQCDQCLDGYWGDPRLLHGCQVCLCNNDGTIFNQCDRNSGACRCKAGITGKYCDKCARGTDGEMPNCVVCGDCWKQWDDIIEQLFASLGEFQNGTMENITVSRWPNNMFVILDKIKRVMKNVPDGIGSQIKQLRNDVNSLINQLENLSLVTFNVSEHDIGKLSKSVALMEERVARNRIKDSGGAYSVLEKTFLSIIESVNNTKEAMKSLEKLNTIRSNREDKMKDINLEKVEAKSNELTNFENNLTKNLQKFNKLTCNSESSANLAPCSGVCGAVGCQPNNCSRTGKINEHCLGNDQPKFFNAYVWKVDGRNNSNNHLKKGENGSQKNLSEWLTKTNSEVYNTKGLIGVTNNTINSKYDKAEQLLERLKTTINIITSEYEFKKLLDAIRNFTLTNPEEEIKQIEKKIKQRIQDLDDKVNEVMKKSKSNRMECDLLKKDVLRSKEKASNLLKSIKHLEDNNKEILKIQAEMRDVILNLNIDESQIKNDLDQVQKHQTEIKSNQSLIDKIILFLKSLSDESENSVKAVQADLDLLQMDQLKIRKRLDSIKINTDKSVQKRKSITDDSNKIKDKGNDKLQQMLEKIDKLGKEIDKTREKIANAKRFVTIKQFELKELSQKVEEKLLRISGLEYEMYAKTEFQSTCLP